MRVYRAYLHDGGHMQIATWVDKNCTQELHVRVRAGVS